MENERSTIMNLLNIDDEVGGINLLKKENLSKNTNKNSSKLPSIYTEYKSESNKLWKHLNNENINPRKYNSINKLNLINVRNNHIIKEDEQVQINSRKISDSTYLDINLSKYIKIESLPKQTKNHSYEDELISNLTYKFEDKNSNLKGLKKSYNEKVSTPTGSVRGSPSLYTRENNNKSFRLYSKIFSKTKSIAYNERIFWSKQKIGELWNRFKIASQKITIKTREDFDKINTAIIQGDDEYVLSKLLDSEFKNFYQIELRKFKLLENILIRTRFNLLLKILEDEFYKFDNYFVFYFLTNLMCQNKKEGKSMSSRIEMRTFIIDEINMLKEIDTVHDKQVKYIYFKFSKIMLIIVKYGLYHKSYNLVRLFAWFLAFFENYNAFRLLIQMNAEIFSEDYSIYNNFLLNQNIDDYLNNKLNYRYTIKSCLEEKLEDLAISLIETENEMQEKVLIYSAIENSSLDFLKYIWENSNKPTEDNSHPNSQINKNNERFHILPIKKHSIINNKIIKFHYNNFNKGENIFSLSELVIEFKAQSKISCLNTIINEWKYLNSDPQFLKTLFDHNCFSQICTLIWKKKLFWNFTEDYFKKVIEHEQVELILYFLTLRECRNILNNNLIQKTIVDNYMKNGNKIFYGSEMLLYLYKANWDEHLTKNLCKNILKTIKTKDILNCHSPILTCLLLCEFLKDISEFSVQHSSRCEMVSSELITFCRNIQCSNTHENYIRYLMAQKDSKGRSCLQIASENSFYQVLETPEIGTLVKKMWNGNISNNGFVAASSMNRYLETDVKKMDPFQGFEILDFSKIYFYQLAVWTDSCSLRYWPESISTVGLILTYNLFIYFLFQRGQILNTFQELDNSLQYLLVIYISWVCSIMLNIFLVLLFSIKTNRKFKLDVWILSEILMFIFSWLLLLDTKKVFGQYAPIDVLNMTYNLLYQLEVPFLKFSSLQSEEYSGTLAFLARAIILAINNILVWLRITGILLTFKEIGPTIRMINLMGILLVKYVLIISLFMACCAAIFTALFFSHSPQFKDFSTSVMSLFSGFVGSFGDISFDSNFKWIGSSLLIAYVCIAGILFINLLIALLSNVYEKMSLVVDASHRSVLISYYRRYKWNRKYGYLIFLTTPISIINYLILPISLLISDDNQERFNEIVCRIYYSIFYFPFIFLTFMVYSFFLIPLCYLKAIFRIISLQKNFKIAVIFKIINVFKWIEGGMFYLIYVYFRDIYYIFKTVFRKVNYKLSETNRIKNFITEEEVVIFLKFIHKRKTDKPNDIHTMFLDYLAFEQKQKAKYDENLREKKIYLLKLNSAANLSKKNQVDLNKSSFQIFNNLKLIITSNYIKKNLIVIEIFENFLIDYESDIISVDLEKMKTLLPMTMNINNAYLKRLVHTDMKALNKAINKFKVEKNVFLQYQLLNKIVASAIRLDKEIDNEITKNLSKKSIKKKKKLDDIKESEDLEEEKEDEFNDLHHLDDLENILEKISDDIKEICGKKKKSCNDSNKNSLKKFPVMSESGVINKSEAIHNTSGIGQKFLIKNIEPIPQNVIIIDQKLTSTEDIFKSISDNSAKAKNGVDFSKENSFSFHYNNVNISKCEENQDDIEFDEDISILKMNKKEINYLNESEFKGSGINIIGNLNLILKNEFEIKGKNTFSNLNEKSVKNYIKNNNSYTEDGQKSEFLISKKFEEDLKIIYENKKEDLNTIGYDGLEINLENINEDKEQDL